MTSLAENDLPNGVWSKIFEYAVWGSGKDPPCPSCKRPYYFELVGRTASAIRRTCHRWRDIWTFYIVIKGMTAPDVPWCISPGLDAHRWANELSLREEHEKPPWLYRARILPANNE